MQNIANHANNASSANNSANSAGLISTDLFTDTSILKQIRPNVESEELDHALLNACMNHPLSNHINILLYTQLYMAMAEDERERFHRYYAAMMYKVYTTTDPPIDVYTMLSDPTMATDALIFFVLLQYYCAS